MDRAKFPVKVILIGSPIWEIVTSWYSWVYIGAPLTPLPEYILSVPAETTPASAENNSTYSR
jgi:hypothetical protein